MIIVDTKLRECEEAGHPVRVAIIGAGFMGRIIAHQFLRPIAGMRLAGIYNRTVSAAGHAYRESGVDNIRHASKASDVEEAISAGLPLTVDRWELLCEADQVDVVIEATGEVNFGAQVALKAIENGKHVVLVNAEVDATVGPILKTYADRAGVIVTNTDGDEPGVAMNLVRFVQTIDYKPVAAGNIKGMIDHYRNPDTQREFAEKYNQKPVNVTSFADGTKLSMEATVLANATGFGVGQPGMYGLDVDHVKDTLNFFTPEHFEKGGLVDFTIGAEPYTGAFVIGYNEDPSNRQYMSYFKMGDGPYYCFYTPYHLPHLQILTTVARAALFNDATVSPLGKPYTDVVTTAKRDLKAGEILDGLGGFCAYGNIENAAGTMARGCLPMGLSHGCRVKRDLARDHVLTYEDVDMPAPRLADRLRAEQDKRFFGKNK
jgi:predicted homoserine dehydrogenase-like protein